MKSILLTFSMLILGYFTYAQTPQSFNYQAVARNADGTVMSDANLGIRVSIVDDATSNIIYSESHAKLTNPLGLFNLQIGKGTVLQGNLGMVNWGGSSYNLKVDIDYSGGTDYTPVGSSPLLSVPYAMHAMTAENVDDADADPNNEIQTLSIAGTTLSISGGNSVTIPSGGTDADADPTNEIQTISKAGTTVTLSDEGGSFEDATADADADPSNEIQTLSIAGTTLSITGGNSVEIPSGGTDADADPLNEIQTLSKSGNSITLSKSGGTVTDDVNDADADPLNELQTLSKTGNSITLSNSGGTVTDDVNDADADPTNELQQLSMLAIADGGIDGMTKYQLQLTGNDPIDMPFNQWWEPTILLSFPPQVGNVRTPYPVVVENSLSATSINSPHIETNDLTVGDDKVSAVHIQSTGIHFDGGPLSNDLGFFFEREELRYGATLPSSDFKARLTKQDLTFSNGGGWQSTYLGGNTSGELSLFPGGGTPQFFRAWLNSNTPTVRLTNGNQKVVEGRPSSQGGGEWATYGTNGNRNVWMTHLNNLPNNGWFGIIDGSGIAQVVLSVNSAGQGIVAADMKNFVMNHPTDPAKNIQYASLEGPEAAAYERGTAQLINGEASIDFSEHFQLVIGDNQMTVMITPLSADSEGIAVIEKRTDGFKVKELHKGKGTYQFDWEVKAIRKGFEDFKPVVNKTVLHPASAVKVIKH